MSALVPHARPDLEDDIRSGVPVSRYEWATLAGLANWNMGHGSMLVPWTFIGHTVTSGGSDTFNFRIAPKAPCVQRVYRVRLRGAAAGASATVTCGTASASSTGVIPTSYIGGRDSFLFVEDLSVKTSTEANLAVTVAASGANVIVDALCVYEQTRSVLDADTDDYGVDLTTVRPRQPILISSYESIHGVVQSYQSLDARRSCLWQWSADPGPNGRITPGSTSYTDLFPLDIPIQGPLVTTGDTTVGLKVAAYARVDTGTGNVRFQTTQASGSVALDITNTGTFGWTVSADEALTTSCEDLTAADGLQSSTFEELDVDAKDPSGGTLDIAGLAVLRVTTPI